MPITWKNVNTPSFAAAAAVGRTAADLFNKGMGNIQQTQGDFRQDILNRNDAAIAQQFNSYGSDMDKYLQEQPNRLTQENFNQMYGEGMFSADKVTGLQQSQPATIMGNIQQDDQYKQHQYDVFKEGGLQGLDTAYNTQEL